MANSTTFPGLEFAEASFSLDYGDELAIAGSGAIRVKQRRPDLWRASFVHTTLSHAAGRRAHAYLAYTASRRDTLYAWDPAGAYPQSDDDGSSIVTPANIKIYTLNADGIRLALYGLPAGFVITRGDYLAFDYGSPTRRALHQVMLPTTIAANGIGLTAEFYVAPAIRAGASVNAVVTLIKAAAEMLIVPGSIDIRAGRNFTALSFDALQVI